MKKNHFYHTVLDVTVLEIRLRLMGVEPHEYEELTDIAYSTVHYTILNVVLTALDTKEHEAFFINLHADDHARTWDHLKGSVSDIEKRIKKAGEKIIQELMVDFEQTKVGK